MILKMNFIEDWQKFLKSELLENGFDVKSISLSDVPYKYFNLMKRLVHPKPRELFLSKEMSVENEEKKAIGIIKSKILKGESLYPYLSSRIKKLNYRDSLLNDWGIHHLHLGKNIEKNGFINRTDRVLFVRFTNEAAFLIDILPHNNWSNQELVRIIHRNWPESISKFRAKGFHSLEREISNDDIHAFRQSGSITMIQIDVGVLYFPIGGGYSTNRTSIEVVTLHDSIANRLDMFERIISENITLLELEMQKLGLQDVNELHLELKIDENTVSAYNEKYDFIMELGDLLDSRVQ